MSEPKLLRMEALSDGLFSVAMTLLLLDIRPKDRPDLQALGDVWWHEVFLNFGLFAASFFLVGIYWVAHKNECHYITGSDRFLDWLNLVFLAAVALLPFSVSVLAEAWHASRHIERAVSLYLGDVALAGVALSCFFAYAVRKKWLNGEGEKNRRLTIQKNSLIPILCAIVWLWFILTPNMLLNHFLWFMAFPPGTYFVFTLGYALREALRRGRQ